MEPKKPKKKGSIVTDTSPITQPVSIAKKGETFPAAERRKGTLVSTCLPPTHSQKDSVDIALARAVEVNEKDEEALNYPPSLQAYMNRIPTKIKADDPDFIPKYQTKGSACCDLVANISPDPNSGKRIVIIPPGNTVVIDCGCSIQLPAGYEAQVRARSGLASKGLIVSNGIGTIDDDYRGRLTVILSNVGREVMILAHKQRIGQMAIKPVWYFTWDVVTELDATERNEGGFGSTGEM